MSANKEVGHGSVEFFYKTKSYPAIGIIIPPKTAIYGATEIDKPYRNKGYGSEMLRLAEQEARKKGMKQMQIPNVDNPHFFTKHGYSYTGNQRIFEKDLTGKSQTALQKNRTEKYITPFKKYSKEN